MNELISIVVPVYKVEDYLDECVESIVKQSYKNLEIILVDDGSPDNCPKICDAWAQKDQRIKVIHQENKGVAAARANGILSSKGEFVCCVDSDDYIGEEMCETILQIFRKNNVEIVVFETECFGAVSKNVSSYPKMEETVLDANTALGKLVKGDIPNYFGNKMYKRHVFDGVDFLEGHLWEDLGVMYRIFLNAKSIYLCNQIFYYYRMRQGSIIHSMNEKALEDIFFAQYKRYSDLLNIYPDTAKIVFGLVAISAIRLYDCSLWCEVDKELLQKATEFLNMNKTAILSLENQKRYTWFYRNRRLYNFARKMRHKIGAFIKK